VLSSVSVPHVTLAPAPDSASVNDGLSVRDCDRHHGHHDRAGGPEV